jgi:hypothetical protein
VSGLRLLALKPALSAHRTINFTGSHFTRGSVAPSAFLASGQMRVSG